MPAGSPCVMARGFIGLNLWSKTALTLYQQAQVASIFIAFISARLPSGGVVDVNELMDQPELTGSVGRHRRRAVPLGGMVPRGNEAHAGFPGQVGLGFGNLARDEDIGTRGNGGLEIALRATRTPGHA